MTQRRMSNRDFLNKYHDLNPYSYGGIAQVQNYFDVSKKKVAITGAKVAIRETRPLPI